MTLKCIHGDIKDYPTKVISIHTTLLPRKSQDRRRAPRCISPGQKKKGAPAQASGSLDY